RLAQSFLQFHLARNIMMPEPPRQERLDQEQHEQPIKQLLMQLTAPPDRAHVKRQLFRVRQIKKIPSRYRLGQVCAIELRHIALGAGSGWAATGESIEGGGPIFISSPPAKSVCSK